MNAMPAPERVLAVSLAHAINEVNVFRKLALLSSNFDQSVQWQKDAQTCQFLALIRVTAGKLYEAWTLLGKTYFKSKLSIEYKERIAIEGQESLDFLKKYFGRANCMVARIRNELAFHYMAEHLGIATVSSADEQEMSFYVSEQSGNILYYFAEHIAGTALLSCVDEPDPRQAVPRLLTELAEVIIHFNIFAQVLVSALIDHALPAGDHALSSDSPIDIVIPCAKEVSIPFYVDFTRFGPPVGNAA